MPEEESNVSKAGQQSTRETNERTSDESRGLGPLQGKGMTIGHVDVIVGGDGLEVPGFVATKHEIKQIVRHWATEIIDLDFEFFLYACTGSSEWRTRAFANRRLHKIASFIGEDEVRRIFGEAEQTFAKSVDQRAWKIFKEGTLEEQERFQEEVQDRLAARSCGSATASRPEFNRH